MHTLKEIILNAGVVLIPGFVHGTLLDKLRAHADKSGPVRGQDQQPKWVNPSSPETHPENWLDWSHYWTAQIGEQPEIQEVMKRLDPITNEILNDWRWWCVDYHVANPGAQYVRAHVDIPYIYEPWRQITGLLGLQFIITIDDFTIENGATCFLPRSHNNPTIDLSTMGSDELNNLLIDNGERLAMKRGSLLIYHPRTLHSTMPNTSNEVRRALLFNAVENCIVDQLKEYDPVCWPENMNKNLQEYRET